MDKAPSPLVTLGVPVYNEGEFLRESLDSFLAQTHTNLEIIIADNGSTDGTSEICNEYVQRDTRVKHIRHLENIGQHKNFNFLPRQAKGKYFAWASGHDLLSPTFVEDCVRVLEHDPQIVLGYPRTVNMFADGTQTREKVRHFDILHMNPSQRFREVMWRVDCNYVYGMWRTEPMMQSHLFQQVPACDRVFLAEMAIKGTFARIDTFKFYRMNRPGRQTELEKRHRLMSYFFPGQKFSDKELSGNSFYKPTQKAYRRVVRDADFNIFQRWYLYLSIWLAGVMKSHLFPGADTLSVIVKKILPAPILKKILAQMQ